MSFRFRHFTIEDDRSTLKVGTDAMLLGAWANPGNAKTILDIDSGCGVLALMMAQKSGALIDAVEIDPRSADQARENFNRSTWSGRLTSVCGSVVDFQHSSDRLYDFIITNPPYFSNQLKSVSMKINRTKHEEGLTVETLVKAIRILLKPEGKFSVIFPYENHRFFINLCKKNGFHLHQQVNVCSRPGNSAIRTMMEFKQVTNPAPPVDRIIILDENGKFTAGYLTLTADFHHF